MESVLVFVDRLYRQKRAWLAPLVVLVILAVSAYAGYRLNRLPVFYLFAAFGALAVIVLALKGMWLGLTLLVFTSGTVGFSIGTGTQSAINVGMMLVALLAGIWSARMVISHQVRLVPSPMNVPLLGFLAAVVLSWVAGYVISNPRVALPDNIFVVQVGQFTVFALTVAAFLLTANHRLGEKALKVWTAFIIVVGVAVVFARAVLREYRLLSGWTGSLLVWPFVLFFAQVLFNPGLDRRLKVLGGVALVLWGYWVVVGAVSWKSSWVPALVAFLLLLLLKSRRLFLLVLLILVVVLYAVGYENVWDALMVAEEYSANPVRWSIWLDVFRLGAQSFVFGLGPANYTYYWHDLRFESISYRYVDPRAFSRAVYAPPAHNMFADIFAQTGIVGLFFLTWALIAAWRLGWRVRQRRLSGFERAHLYGVLCGFISLTIASFFFAEWLLPYVYNLGLVGFRQSVYAWLLLGTLVGLGMDGQTVDIGVE